MMRMKCPGCDKNHLLNPNYSSSQNCVSQPGWMRSRGNCAPDSLGPLVRANWRQTAIYIATNCTAPRLLSDGYHPTARLGNNLTGQQQIPLDFSGIKKSMLAFGVFLLPTKGNQKYPLLQSLSQIITSWLAFFQDSNIASSINLAIDHGGCFVHRKSFEPALDGVGSAPRPVSLFGSSASLLLSLNVDEPCPTIRRALP